MPSSRGLSLRDQTHVSYASCIGRWSLPLTSPGGGVGVGGIVVKSCLTLVTPWTQAPARLLCPWDSPGKNTGVGYHFLLQAIFLTQGSNLRLTCFLHWQVSTLPLVPPEKPMSPCEGCSIN